MPIALRFAARSNLGLGSKTRNEDSAFASPDLLVLADGMGGHAAGDTASATVVAELMTLDGESWGADEAAHQLRQAVRRANDRLRQMMDTDLDTEGMGTTLIAFIRSGTKLAMANIGDSRAYLVRDGVFTQLTKDHSFVQALLDEGRITPEEAEHHPQRSMVTRVLTGREDDDPDISMREAQRGDRLLICSDGLSDYVARSTIEGIMTSPGSPGDIADRLIEIALKASTRDNVTVVVAEVVDGKDPISSTPQIVGAAADRAIGHEDDETQEQPQEPRTPAEKAAALQRETARQPAPPQPVHPGDDYDDGGETHGLPQLAEEKPNKGGKLRWFGLGAVLIAMAVAGALLGYNWTQSQYYVGANSGKVAIFKGVPQDLGPVSLSSIESTTNLQVKDLPSFYRDKVNNTMTAKDKADAQRVVADLQKQLERCKADTSGSNCAS